MKLRITRDDILNPLQVISGVVERKQTMPVLSNLLFQVSQDEVSITGTNTEVELVCRLEGSQVLSEGQITIPARKLFDICRSLPENSEVELSLEGDKVNVVSGKSQFTLSTLPADQFPNIDEEDYDISISFNQNEFKGMIDATSFAMAQQDVRYYLNGLLLELNNQTVRTVATDGHRLAMATMALDVPVDESRQLQVIVPRKGILELGRLLSDSEDEVEISIGRSHIFSKIGQYTFTSKLIDGKFPDYTRVIPQGGDKIVIADRNALKAVFSRASILSHENIRGIQLQLSANQVQVFANNPDHEHAEDYLDVIYDGTELQIGFNVSYLIDVLNAISDESVKITLSNSSSSALIESTENADRIYVVMPMRL